MKLFIGLILTSLLASPPIISARDSASSTATVNDDELTSSFDSWTLRHAKVYESVEERNLRHATFLKNQDIVDRHNQAYAAGYTAWAMSTLHSPFADLTADEFATAYLMDAQNCSATTHVSSGTLRTTKHDDEVSTSQIVDWRTQGIMTPIKNQGHCGSCWTFSTTGCLESHLCLQGHKDCTKWNGLAEQQLVDCAGAYNNNGCSGGLPSQAYEYIKYYGGIETEENYPYKANDTGTCDAVCPCCSDDYMGRVAAVYNITSGDEDDLVYAVAAVGPVSIAYQVSPDFRFYAHGVYDSWNATTNQTMCNNTAMDVNHAVVAVGLGITQPSRHTNSTSDGVPYYIVRNSWGTSWGMEGHFWMKRGENLCGVSDCASFPIVPAVDEEATACKKKNDSFLRAVVKNKS